MQDIKLGIYQHFKGKKYQVIGLAKHSETMEDLVVYKPLFKIEKEFEGLLWIRPKKMFFEKVLIKSKKVSRFRYIND